MFLAEMASLDNLLDIIVIYEIWFNERGKDCLIFQVLFLLVNLLKIIDQEV